jgi:hypothetical protein
MENLSIRITDWRLGFLPVAVVMTIFGVGALLLQGGDLSFPDEKEYVQLGRQLLRSAYFSYDGTAATAFRPPGYPFVIAGLSALRDSNIFIKGFNVGCWIATAYVMFVLCRTRFSETSAILAVVIFVAYFPELFAATTVYPQTLLGLVTVVSILVVTNEQLSGWSRTVGLSVLSLFAIFLVPNAIVTFVVCIAYLLLVRGITIRQAIVGFIAVFGGVLAWSWRNKLEIGAFTFATNMGMNFLFGYNDEAGFNTGSLPDVSGIFQSAQSMGEADRDRYYRTLAFEWIQNHPWRTVMLFIGKALNWFNTFNTFKTETANRFGWASGAVIAVVYYPILFLAALFCVKMPKRDRAFGWLLWAIYILTGLSYAAFYTRIRYRLPVDPLMIILAAGYLGSLLKPFRGPVSSASITERRQNI